MIIVRHLTLRATSTVLAAFALAVAAGCANGGDSSTATPDGSTTTPTTAQPVTTSPTTVESQTTDASVPPDTTEPQSTDDPIVVWVDNNRPEGFPATYQYFFPDDITVHPGQTVEFKMDWSSGEPHNVALGTIVDGAREAIDALPPQETTISPGFPLPVSPELQAKFAKMPQALPPDQASTADTMRLAQPCYLETEDPPLGEPCGPDQRSPTRPFDGTQSFVSSQVMINDGDAFELELDEAIAPGTYTYICTLHPSFMFGSMNVVPADEPADSPADVASRGQAAIDELNERYRPEAERLAAQPGPSVEAGALGDGGNRPEITINVFPNEIAVGVGETITWDIVGAHMLTFSPPEGRPLFSVLEEVDGVVRPLDWQPDQPSPGRPGMPEFVDVIQAMATQQDLAIDGGEVAADEYLHTGLLFGSLGPLPKTLYGLRFSQPGVFTYYCVRHPGMLGTVNVGVG